MKLQILLLALPLQFTSLFAQNTNDSAPKTAASAKQALDTPTERERIKTVCLAETQAFNDLNYDGWAAVYSKGEGAEMNWNNPDGTFSNVSGWDNMSAALKGYMQSATKSAGKLSQSNFSILINGNMAQVGFDQSVKETDGKIGKSRQHRTMIYDARSLTWKILVMNAFLDYSNTNMSNEAKDKAAIQQVVTMETEYWLDRNLEAWSNSFVQQPTLVWTVTNGGDPGDVLTVRGWDELKGFMKNWFEDEANSVFANEMRKNNNTRDHWQIEIRGDVAWASFDQHMVNSKQTTVSTETRVLERVNGAWKVTMQSSLADFKDAVPPIRSRY